MSTGEIIALICVAVVICLAFYYIIRSKKRGKKCIGCPYADCCNRNSNCSSKRKTSR